MKRLALLALFVLACQDLMTVDIAGRTGNVYYVAKTGNDGNPGTKQKPWLTVTHAAAMVQAGDLVLVNAGVYDEDVNFSGNPGTAEAPITFKSNAGWNTVLWGVQFINQPHYVIDGFCLTMPDNLVRMQAMRFDASNITLRNCEVKMAVPHSYAGTCGVLWGSGRHRSIVVTGNSIHGFGAESNGHGIYANEAVGATITHNDVYDNQQYGIQAYASIESCEIAYNYCHDNLNKSGILIEGYYNRVHHNICTGNGQHGIVLVAYHPGGNNTLYSNTVAFNSPVSGGIVVSDYGNDSIYGNIVYGNGVEFWLSTTVGVVTDYNCFAQDRANLVWWTGHGYGSLADYQALAGQELHGMAVDPMFVDPIARNFHLQPGSLCIDAGDPATPPDYDFDGVATPQGLGFDIGAFEYMIPRTPRRVKIR